MMEAFAHNAFALPSSTPAVVAYPNLVDSSQHAKENFRPAKRAFKRVPSAQENEFALKRILKEYWGYTSFRDRQLEICMEVMKGNDVFVNAPTGIGKSICFQVPAITLEHGITIVITPLLALMHDQVSTLRRKGIEAATLNSNTRPEEAKEIRRQLSMGHPELRLLYVTPETLFGVKYSADFRRAYQQKQLMRLVIDEAHVIDDWGWDFRPEYSQLGRFRQTFPDVPITALTASATVETRRHICSILGIRPGHYAQFVFAVNRKNLFYEVKLRGNEKDDAKIQDVVRVIKECRKETIERGRDVGVGLVYCRQKDSCREVCETLKRNGISSKVYHAGLREAEKERAVREWTDGTVHCIVATIAFGMGIDKPDVRYVIHYDLPHGVEAYYQETGRAGRDGHMSRCVLYYSREDARRRRVHVDCTAEKAAKNNAESEVAMDVEDFKRRYTNSFKLLQSYAEAVDGCRHIAIARYFGESKIDEKDEEHLKAYCDKMCDLCKNRGAVLRRACNVSEDIPLPSQAIPAPIRSDSVKQVSSSSGLPSSLVRIHGSHFLDSSSDGTESATEEDREEDRRGRAEAGPSRFRQAVVHCGNRKTSQLRSAYINPSSQSAPSPPAALTGRSAYQEPMQVYNPRSNTLPHVDQSIRPPLANISTLQKGNLPMPPPSTAPVQPGEGSYAVPDSLPANDRKRKAQQDRFFATEPAGGDGPYKYYSLTNPSLGHTPRRSQKNSFKPPFLQKPERTGYGTILADRRARALKDLLRDLRGICEEGDLADRVWVSLGRAEEEVARDRKAVLKKVAREYEMDLAKDAKHVADYETTLGTTLKALRILSANEGVEMLESGQLERDHKGRAEVDILLALGERIRACH